jgi:Flp pilus assembly protein TadD
MNKVALKVAASTLVLGVTMVGCTASADMYRPRAASASTSANEAMDYYDRAQAAAARRDFAEALTLTEKAVELSPRDVAYRMMLADLYVRNGRFASAEDTFADVLELNPANERAALHLALTRIAQGDTASAIATLDFMGEDAEAADLGLAYALAGQPLRAIEILEPAARADDARARVRQNLALAYALAGDWQKARVTAAQDVSPAELDARMEQWAAFAQPATSYDQVASLLGVTPAADPGQPVRLALAPEVPEAPEAAYAVADLPVELPIARGAEVTVDLPPPVMAAAVEMPAEPVPAPVIDAPALEFADVVRSLTDQPTLIRASAPITEVPIPAFEPVKRSSKKVRQGRFVVQLGAFSSPVLVERAWSQARKRYGFADDRAPVSTTVKVGARMTLHRLAVGGFGSHADADRFCTSIKARQGVCFVRAAAGDAPLQWASKDGGRKA